MRHGTQGHLAVPCGPMRAEVARTCGRATRVHADAQVAPHGSVRGLRVMGPRVSGPMKEYWGGNTNALRSPTFYTCQFFSFSLCGIMFHFYFELQATWLITVR